MASKNNSIESIRANLPQSFRKIPFLVLISVISVVALLYIINTIAVLTSMLAFDVSASSALNNAIELIPSVVTAIILLPVVVCTVISAIAGWELFLFPKFAVKNVSKLAYFSSANRAYHLYVYVFSAIGFAISSIFYALFAYVIPDTEEFISSMADVVKTLNVTSYGEFVDNLKSESSEQMIAAIISFIAIIVICVLVAGAFSEVSKYFAALAGTAKNSDSKLAKSPVVKPAIAAVLFLIIGIYSFANGNAMSGILNILLTAFFVSAIIYFDSVVNARGYATITVPTRASKDDEAEDVAEEQPSSVPMADLEEVTAENEATDDITEEEGEIPAAEEVAEEAPVVAEEPASVEETAEQETVEGTEEAPAAEVVEEVVEDNADEASEAEEVADEAPEVVEETASDEKTEDATV